MRYVLQAFPLLWHYVPDLHPESSAFCEKANLEQESFSILDHKGLSRVD